VSRVEEAGTVDGVHLLPTPEGVPLRLPLATTGDRVAAFLLDSAIVATALFLLILLAGLFGSGGSGVGTSLVLVAVFLLRNFYFAGFELAWRGRTPGKRYFGLRVMDVHGAGLSTEAVLARNLTREIETFVPLVMVVAPESLWPGGSGVVRLIAALWGVGLVVLPLLNRQRRRAGDFIAGTLVVSTRDATLDRDLATDAPQAGGAAQAGHVFTPEQLTMYGERELHVLEELLRRPAHERRDATREVAKRIMKKIGWDSRRKVSDPDAFLRDFYAAQRAELEKEMLFGRRHGDKHERARDAASDGQSKTAARSSTSRPSRMRRRSE